MNLIIPRAILACCLIPAGMLMLATDGKAAPRHRPANPRGIADPRGVFDPRGPFDRRNPHRYLYGLPGGYAMRTYAGVRYYYCSVIYYYPYMINGQTVYTRCTVANGVPVVPVRPY